MKKFSRKFKRELKKIKRFLSANDFELLLKHCIALIRNNLKILKNPEIEKKINARRGYVYLVDFGYTTGGVLRNKHYCVVLSTQSKTSIVIPLTSKQNNKFGVDLGIIPNLSNKNIKSYALVNQITTVSRLMLIVPRSKKKVKLSSEQLDKIEKELEKILLKKALPK